MNTTTINEIKELYKQIPNKSEFFLAAELEFNLKASSIKSNWFSGVWGIPNDKIYEVFEFMANYLNQINIPSDLGNPKNQHQQALWYLINWKEFSLKEVINHSMFYKFQSRLSEIEREHGYITKKTTQSFINKFGKKGSYKLYKCIDKQKAKELVLKY